MLKRRLYWFGLGSGIIIGTMLLQLMIWGQEQAIDFPEEASPPVHTDQMYTEEQVEEIRSAVREEVMAEMDVNQRSEEQDIVQEEVLVRGFVVQSGMNSNDLIDLLLQLQLIDDKTYFKQLLSEDEKDTRIKTGIYHFKGQPSPEEIVARIAPLDEA